MFGYIDKQDKKLKNIVRRNYYLTQGDSFSLVATPTDGDVATISKLVFKIGTQNEDGSLNEVYTQDYDQAGSLYLLDVQSETTSEWKTTESMDGVPYIYEIEVHYIDGGVNTIMQADFTVESQIRR